MRRTILNSLSLALCLSGGAAPASAAESSAHGLAHAPSTQDEQSAVRTTVVPVYGGAASLQKAMLAARATYRRGRQPAAEGAGLVKLGGWHVAQRPIAEQELAGPFDFGRQDADGRPLWTPQPEWQDGRVLDISGGPWTACRTITAERAVQLWVGLGGGDRLVLYVNGREMLSADTALPYRRYGTSMRLDDTRHDQVVVAVALEPGEHQLAVRVEQDSAGPRQFYFSLAANPVPYIWRQLEEEFPRQTNRLLAAVPAAWFGADGWLARTDTGLEREFLDDVLPRLGGRGAALRQQAGQLAGQDGPDGETRWLQLCVAAAELDAIGDGLDRLRAAVTALGERFPADGEPGASEYPAEAFLQRLAALESRVVEASASGLDPSGETTAALRAELAAGRREMLVMANPLLRGQSILFARRYTYDSPHFYDDFYQGIHKYGGSLAKLSIDDGAVTDVVPELNGGVFDRFDLSFDAQRVVFGYRAPRPEGMRLWEVRVDGSGLRQLTFEPADEQQRMARYSLHAVGSCLSNAQLHAHWTDDMHPCYLPDGRIVLASSRCERTAVCGGHTLPCTVLYRIDADGGNMERLSQGMLSEFTPAVLDDGRILYTRWEYVYKGIAAIQPMWVMRPDGSGSEEVYGNNIRDPGVFYHARQVPGHSNLLVATGCGHEPLAVGSILLVDLHANKRTEEAMTSLTPDTTVRELRGLYQRRNGQWRQDVYGPFYCDPFPLSEQFFLVSANPNGRYNDEAAYGIYLLDVFGNLTPIYDDPETSCFTPTLLAPRPVPPVLPAVSRPGAVAAVSAESPPNEPADGAGTLFLADVYEGLPGVERGEVKYLRVLRQVERPWSVWPYAQGDTFPGQMVAISWYSHIWIAVLEGVVPVEEDGSAYFTAPADANLFFQALDGDFLEVQRMRTFINLRPGEQRSCIGCHEHRTQTPPGNVRAMPLALRSPPVSPGPQPGDIAPRPLHYETDVQPIFDKHCVSCHGNSDPEGELVLSGEPTDLFNRSYEEIMRKGLINTVREWSTPPGEGSWLSWSMEHTPPIAPYSLGSHRSRLIEVLREGHHDVALSRAEFVKLATWVDTNGQYYGSYFGLRNLRHRDTPGFREPPSLESAYGVRPGQISDGPFEPVPAELVAHWPFDEQDGTAVYDASGGSHHAELAGSRRIEGRLGRALDFSGNADFVRAGDLPGEFATLSIAFWVKPHSLGNQWNAVLFCDDWSEYDLHLSLLPGGNANVAINRGQHGTPHFASFAEVGTTAWRHVAVVCDLREGGSVRFFIDGRPDRRHHFFGPASVVRLSGIRLGGYNAWEKQPGANYHGALDDFRIYRGMLNEQQIRELASGP